MAVALPGRDDASAWFDQGGRAAIEQLEDALAALAGYELTRGVLCAMRRPSLPAVEELCAGARRVAVRQATPASAPVVRVRRKSKWTVA